MSTLEIFDKESGFLSFDLRDVLKTIEPFGSQLHWYVVEFEPAVLAGGKNRRTDAPPEWVMELWRKTEKGAVEAMTWDRLKELSTHVTQTMNALIVGADPATEAPTASMNPNDNCYRLVLQAVDTSFWAVTSQDENVLQALRRRFHDVKLQAATRRYF